MYTVVLRVSDPNIPISANYGHISYAFTICKLWTGATKPAIALLSVTLKLWMVAKDPARH